jgi:hypothetical protein
MNDDVAEIKVRCIHDNPDVPSVAVHSFHTTSAYTRKI